VPRAQYACVDAALATSAASDRGRQGDALGPIAGLLHRIEEGRRNRTSLSHPEDYYDPSRSTQ